jgi:hypothetical protein
MQLPEISIYNMHHTKKTKVDAKQKYGFPRQVLFWVLGA